MEIDVTPIEKEVRQDVELYVAPIKSFLVVDDPTMQRSGDTIKEIDKRMKAVDAKFQTAFDAVDEAKRKATTAKSALVALIDEIKAPYVELKAYLVRQGKDYLSLGAKKQEEERQRLVEIARKEEEERRLAEAEALEKAGMNEEAEAVIQEPIYFTPVVPPPPQFKVDGRSFQKRWKGQGRDIRAAVKYIAANPQFIGLLQFNDVAINNMARAVRGASPVAGVQFYEE